MKPLYCYWSVCDGEYGSMMEHCVRSARRAGVFTPFHVLCDRVLDGCECYDAFRIEKADGLFKLHYLKAGMSRLNYEYFVWLDADSLFLRKPVDILSALCRAPLHVPLEENLSALAVDRAGRIYVVDAAAQVVQVFSPDGQLLMYFGGPDGGGHELSLPAGIAIDYDNVERFRPLIAPNFSVEYLVLVSSQYGDNKINIYGFGHQQ